MFCFTPCGLLPIYDRLGMYRAMHIQGSSLVTLSTFSLLRIIEGTSIYHFRIIVSRLKSRLAGLEPRKLAQHALLLTTGLSKLNELIKFGSFLLIIIFI